MLTQCQHCKVRFQVADGVDGQKVRCTKCGQTFEICEYVDPLPRKVVRDTPKVVKPQGGSYQTPESVGSIKRADSVAFFGKSVTILLGIASTAIAVTIACVAVIFGGIYLHTTTLFFVIPIGGIFAGILCGGGLFWGIHLTHLRSGIWHEIASIFLAVFGWIGIYYGLYETAYMSSDMEINHDFIGVPLRDFVSTNVGRPVTFWDYLTYDVKNRQSSFWIVIGSKKSGSVPLPIGSAGLGSLYNWFKFVLEGIGFVIGGISAIVVWGDSSTIVDKFFHLYNRLCGS